MENMRATVIETSPFADGIVSVENVCNGPERVRSRSTEVDIELVNKVRSRMLRATHDVIEKMQKQRLEIAERQFAEAHTHTHGDADAADDDLDVDVTSASTAAASDEEVDLTIEGTMGSTIGGTIGGDASSSAISVDEEDANKTVQRLLTKYLRESKAKAAANAGVCEIGHFFDQPFLRPASECHALECPLEHTPAADDNLGSPSALFSCGRASYKLEQAAFGYSSPNIGSCQTRCSPSHGGY